MIDQAIKELYRLRDIVKQRESEQVEHTKVDYIKDYIRKIDRAITTNNLEELSDLLDKTELIK